MPLLASEESMVPGQLSPKQDAAIGLPPSLFEHIDTHINNYTGLVFGIYDRPTLFPVRGQNNSQKGKKRTEVGSSIISALVGVDLELQNLTQPVISTFRLQNKSEMVIQILICLMIAISIIL